jgi:hypothetical protein
MDMFGGLFQFRKVHNGGPRFLGQDGMDIQKQRTITLHNQRIRGINCHILSIIEGMGCNGKGSP